MATYNWSYRPNIPNKYNVSIPNGNDDVRPSNVAYIALFGNDAVGNGSRMYPWKSIQKAIDARAVIIIVGAGTYREAISTLDPFFMYADGDVVFDYSYYLIPAWVKPYGGGTYCHGLKFKGIGLPVMKDRASDSRWVDCYFDNCYPHTNGFGLVYNNNNARTIFNIKDFSMPLKLGGDGGSFEGKNMTIVSALVKLEAGDFDSYIYSDCKIIIGLSPYMRYSLFHNCTFSFDNGVTFISYATVEDLKQAISDNKPSILNYFQNNSFGDPKFNNATIGDFSLAFDSPAKNMSYFGTYIGAQSIAYPVKASATEADGSFDFSTAVNINIADNSIAPADDSLLASIETKVITNLIQRELGKAPIYGFNADRNGQYIDSIADLAITTIAPGTDLTANTPYIVEVAAIIYDGHTIQPGERFTTLSVISFTSAGGGVCREIIEAPQRHTIMARFADVDSDLANTPYQHYEPGVKFTSNNVGNSRTGAIVRGNGDPLYERGTEKEFPINARYIQVKYIIQPNNLKP